MALGGAPENGGSDTADQSPRPRPSDQAGVELMCLAGTREPQRHRVVALSDNCVRQAEATFHVPAGGRAVSVPLVVGEMRGQCSESSPKTMAPPPEEGGASSASFVQACQEASDVARNARRKELRLLFRPHKKEHHYMAFATAINELAEQEDSADSDVDSHDNDETLAIELSLLRNIATLLRPRKAEKHFLYTGRDIL